MGRVLVQLEAFDGETLAARSHPLLGRPSMHASTIEGGVGMSTYPERCRVHVERRTLPGETNEAVEREIADVCARALAPVGAHARVKLFLSAPPSDVDVSAPIVRALASATQGEGRTPAVLGMSAWTDAALFNEAGIPAVCFGPGDISLAHAAEEFVEEAQIEEAAAILTRLARDWCRGAKRE